MANLTAYFDDSGGRETDTIIIAGYVAPVHQWTRFKQEWNGVLDDPDYGLPPNTIFHMKEFAHSVGQFKVFKGEVEDSAKREKRKRLIERLVAFTRIRATKSFSISLRESDYEEVNREFLLRESFGGPFAFAGRACAGMVRRWASDSNPPIRISDVEFVFENGIQGWGDLE